jgi:AraC-like DNA-binding protein
MRADDSRPYEAELAGKANPGRNACASVGCESEEAFSRAFKREFGMSPAHSRDQQPAG